nr:MAG TPA: hypothetical protein [Caudoviricetes sp.]
MTRFRRASPIRYPARSSSRIRIQGSRASRISRS